MNDLPALAKNEFPQFWDLPIAIGDIEYWKSGFDAVNTLLILDCILNENKSNGLAIILPNDPSIIPIIITECLLSLLMYDVLQSGSDFISKLKIGDTVGLLHKRQIQKGTYLGKETDEDGNCYYNIKIKDCENKIPESRKWRIKTFSSLSAKGRGRKGITIPGQNLEELFGLPSGEILSIQQSKVLFVTGEKTILKSFSRSLIIGGDDFEAIFPMTDYTAPSRQYLIGRNPLGRDPLMGFVSAPDVAVDIASKDDKQRLIVMIGKSKATSSGSIERLRSMKHRPSLMFLLGPNDDEELKNLADAGMDCWVWSASDFKRIIGEASETVQPDDHPFAIHQKLVARLSRRSESQKIIELPGEAGAEVLKILSNLKEISNRVPDRLETGQLIGSCHRMLRDLSQLSIPMEAFETFLEASERQSAKFGNRLDQLSGKFAGAMGFGIPTDLAPKVRELLASFATVHAALKSSNPKFEALSRMATDLSPHGTGVVCGDRDQMLAMRQWGGLPEGITVIDQSGFPLDDVPSVIVTGWLSRSFAKKSMLAATENITHLFYGHEMRTYEKFNKYCHTGTTSIIDRTLRNRMFGGIFSRGDATVGDEGQSDEDMQSVLDLILAKFHPTFHLTGGENDVIRQARLTVFDDGSYTYFSKDSRVDRLDRQGRNIDTCDIGDISSGDEIIITDRSRKLFDQMIAAKLLTPEYRKLTETGSIWRLALKDYIEKKNMDVKTFADELGKAGCKRAPLTIRKWLDGNVIIPEDNAIDVIAEVTGDERLKNELAEVRSACRAIHSLHTRIGYLLVRKILDAKVKMEDDDIDDELKKNIGDYANNARILTVQTVSNEEYPVPQGALGEIISIS